MRVCTNKTFVTSQVNNHVNTLAKHVNSMHTVDEALQRSVWGLMNTWQPITVADYSVLHKLNEVKNDHRSKFSNLSSWKEEAWKNQGFNGIRTLDLRDTGAMLLPTELWSHTLGARPIPLKPWFFQASSFQLLKLDNLLRWSFLTLIYNRSSNIWIISYILHIINWTLSASSQCLISFLLLSRLPIGNSSGVQFRDWSRE